MGWSCRLLDSMTGLLAEPVDVPSLSWSLTVSGASLRTTPDEEGVVEAGSASGLRLPWEAVPGATREARMRAVAPYRRGLVLAMDGRPVIAGIIGDRSDTWADTGFDLVAPLDMLASRYLVREGAFGAGPGSTTTDAVALSGLSARAVVCEAVRLCTSAKPGGALPVDLPYAGEAGSASRSWEGWDVANLSCKQVVSDISSAEGGPDVQLRPYLPDPSHLRWRLVAGSDAQPSLSGPAPGHSLTWRPGGGTVDSIEVGWGAPVMRVYGTGAGQDQGTLCALSEDLSLVRTRDPMPLVEATCSDTSWPDSATVRSHAAASVSRPTCQIVATVSATDPAHTVRPGLAWPGEPVRLWVEGYPSLPDGAYDLRIMEMSGDLGDAVTVTFDAVASPWEG